MGRYLPVFTAILFLVVATGFAWLFLFSGAPEVNVGSQPSESVTITEPVPASPPVPEQVTAINEGMSEDIPEAPPTPSNGLSRIKVTVTSQETFSRDNMLAELYAVPEETSVLEYELEVLQTFQVKGQNEFFFEDLASEKYLVAVYADGLMGQSIVGIEKGDREKEANVYLIKAGSISGTVVTSEGEAVAGATVIPVQQRLINVQGEMSLRFEESVIAKTNTGEEGEFTLSNLTGIECRLCVSVAGTPPHYTDFYTVGAKGVRIVLGSGGSVTGVLIEEGKNTPLADTELTFTGPLSTDEHKIVTDASGSFAISELGVGEYSVALANNTYVLMAESQKVQVESVQTTQVELKAAAGAVITGRVLDASTNAGIGKVWVYVSPMDNNATRTKGAESKADGSYSIEGLAPGSYTVSRNGNVEGFVESYYSPERNNRLSVQLRAGEVREKMNFKLYPGIKVTGMVVDREGESINEVSVSAQSPLGGSFSHARTGKDGAFVLSISNVVNDLQISAQKPGFGKAFLKGISVPAEGVQDLKLILGPESSVSGVLVDSAGRRRSTGGVYLMPIDGSQQGNASQVNEDGTFRVTRLSAGVYSIHPSATTSYSINQGPHVPTVEVGEGEDVTGLRVVIDDAGGMSISGMVRDTKGDPISDVDIMANGGPSFEHGRSSSDGSFEIMGLEDGIYRLDTSHNNYSDAIIEGVAAGTQDLEIMLESMSTITGVVLDAQTRQPVSEYQVTQTKNSRNNLQYAQFFSVYHDEGRFTLSGVDAGDTTIYVRAEGYQEAAQMVTGIVGGETVEGVQIFLIPGGSLSGTVMDIQRNPLSNVMIIEGSFNERMSSQGTRAITDSEGHFELSSLPAESVQITAYHPSYAPSTIRVDASTNQEIDFVLSTGGVLEGTVTKNGQALANQYIYFYCQTSGTSTQVNTNADGFYQKKGLQPGTYQLHCNVGNTSLGQQRSRSQEAEVEEGMVTEVNFAWSLGNASLSGVISREGTPLKETNISVEIESVDGMESFGTQTDKEGYYLLEGLPAGKARMTIMGMNVTRRHAFTLDIDDGQSYEYNYDFSGGAKIVCTFSHLPPGREAIVGLSTDISIQSIDTVEDLNALGSSIVASAQGTDNVVELEGIEPGTYSLIGLCLPQNVESAEEAFQKAKFVVKSITIEGKETVEVSFEF